MNEYHQNASGSSSEEVSKDSQNNLDMKRTEYVRRTWIRNIETDTPKKYRPHATYRDHENNICKVPLRVPVMFHPPSQSDLESVIREYENNFLKPTEVDTSNKSRKNKNFVKKIVAAFEEKYKAYNESKIEEDVKAILENRELFLKMEKPSASCPSKNINTFANTSKMCRPGSNKEEDNMYALFNTPEKKQYNQKNMWKSICSSPFKSSTPKESKFMKIINKYHPDEELPSDINDNELDEKLDNIPKKDVNLNEELNFDNNRKHNAEVLEENGRIVRNRENDSMIEEVKIVASTSRHRMQKNFNESFEEEETDIDWLPSEKELSRKKPLKKLLSKLGIVKKSKKVCLYQNANKEFQDSGYDEVNLSSSPLNKSTSENGKSNSFKEMLYSSKMQKSAAKKSIEKKFYNDEASGGITSTDLETNSEDKISTAKPITSICGFISTVIIPKYFLEDVNNSSVTIMETDDNMSTIELYSNCSLLDCINKNCSHLEAEELEILEKMEYSRDIYKKFFSQSDTRINDLRAYNDAKQKESTGNYRKPRPRPATTSFYEDVLSLRRRMGSLPNFYSCPEHNPIYATVKRGHKCRFCDHDRQRIFDEIQPDLSTSL
ncbi:hypothetical protein V1478_007090 [Vespula squamosa]|uniref:Uncharacterized protein n=1 Tax=Vespula squamosa TaxID=30214 RepID=A0ABD2B264_VESSQ